MDILLKTYRDSIAIKLPDEEEWKRMVFEKRAANSLGAYNNERNKIILNKLLLEEENPRKIIRTLLHEARHAFQRFAVEHPWRAKPDESNIYSWEFSIENYISSGVNFNMYQSQSIEADADDFALRVVFSGQII